MARTPDRRSLVVEKIREALRSGRLRPGDPIRTGLAQAAAWGTSHPTFRAALRSLEETGELESAARGFRVPRPRLPGRSARVLWLSACGCDGTISGESEREMRLRRHLDLACRRDGLHLRVAGVNSEGRIFLEGFPATDLAIVLKDAFGAVLCPWRMGGEGSRIAQQLANSSVPSALWGEGGLQGSELTGTRARIFDNGHMGTAGRGAGIHLRDLGHTTVAYLSVYNSANWSKRRLEGLKSVFEPAGRVASFAVEGILHPLASPGSPPNPLAPLLEEASRSRQLAHRVADIVAAWELLRREETLLATLEPLMSQALEDPEVTAWVCSNDTQALLAMRWLRERGVDVPGRISIAGFDDSNRGQDQGLTSWSFSEGDLAEAMVRHLVDPVPGTTVRIEGSLVPRGSTAVRVRAP